LDRSLPPPKRVHYEGPAGASSHFLGIVLFALTACTEKNVSKYPQAAGALGFAVGLAAINRAITGDCWGRCSVGYICNRETGLCEPGECLTACDVGSHCVRNSDGETYCVPEGLAFGSPKPASPPQSTTEEEEATETAAVGEDAGAAGDAARGNGAAAENPSGVEEAPALGE
jgi:hypothetical protein